MKFSDLIKISRNKERAHRIIHLLSAKIKSLEDYVLHKNQDIDFNLNDFERYMADDAEPLERILKNTLFYGHEFILLDNVFSPRPETELVTEVLLEQMGEEENYIDLCCGSGVIGISVLLRKPHISATLLDIGSEAIENTRQNLLKHNLRANLVQDDWLNHLKGHNYEIISANFPYVGPTDPINENVLKYDPKIALFAEDGGWYHYQKLLEHLETNGSWKLVVLECNPLHSRRWREAESRYDYSFLFREDYNRLLRAVIIRRRNQS